MRQFFAFIKRASIVKFLQHVTLLVFLISAPMETGFFI